MTSTHFHFLLFPAYDHWLIRSNIKEKGTEPLPEAEGHSCIRIQLPKTNEESQLDGRPKLGGLGTKIGDGTFVLCKARGYETARMLRNVDYWAVLCLLELMVLLLCQASPFVPISLRTQNDFLFWPVSCNVNLLSRR